jgi:KDO2-lipid IV(A) lauroyltransferase
MSAPKPTQPNLLAIKGRAPTLADRAANILVYGIIAGLRAIPYRWRVPMMGWVIARLVAPLAGYSKRVQDNLALILPDLPPAEVRRLMVQVPNNAGRTLIELYSGAQFKAHVAHSPIIGTGLAAVEAAIAKGQGVIFVSGHFGNHDVLRAVLSARGHDVAALYQPLHNVLFEAHWQRAISSIAQPIFPTGRHGLGALLQHLRGGGMVGLLNDQHMPRGADLTFFNHPAKTALSAAEMALKYNCLLVPVYGLRLPDGLNFELHIQPPIAHSTAEVMTQALNDSLEAMVRAHMDQWFWVHRRWWKG